MNEKNFSLLRWTPVAASVALMLLIIVISLATVSGLKKATHWREQTFQDVLDAQAFEDKLVDAQTSVRGYTEKGQANLLLEYKNDTNVDLQEFNQLMALSHNNPEQERRLQNLAAAVKAVFADDNQVIGIYARQGSNAAIQTEKSDEADGDNALQDLEQYTDDEENQLNKEDTTEQKDYHLAERLLIVSSMFVALLLIVANWVAGREMARRRKAEQEQRELIEKLQNALAEVKTLSGLIPICGWCKSVRNDTGYWQSVELYVRAHTDATFSHGICPSCAEKFKAEILKANPEITTKGQS